MRSLRKNHDYQQLERLCDEYRLDLTFTTGGKHPKAVVRRGPHRVMVPMASSPGPKANPHEIRARMRRRLIDAGLIPTG